MTSEPPENHEGSTPEPSAPGEARRVEADRVDASLREELHEWLTGLPDWQQDLVRRLTQTTHLEGEDLDEARRMVLAAHDALPDDLEAPDPVPLELDDLPGGEVHGGVRLVRIARLRGVGMVASDQELEFAEGLTIVYGPNAAGKSSYVSALKRVCRTVDCDATVRGNVFAADEPERPTATVEYVRGGERRASGST
jgi:hypothetical protein